ncbi:uncharacterized protein LOC129617510 [Condylostylus longicornis]|uniref:uncharacterized protein LOC129617510 n=1 Tax=Condylostylus longicornis TaxID=2530218 RepID=UPI00244E3E7F|nr:uncharacterized protein LOC129617510 [Condylostylus longicornis]
MASSLVSFWRSSGPPKWFSTDAAFDQELRDRFQDLHFEAARRNLDTWMETPDGALALILLLDQIPRNIFRGSSHMFATDSLARTFASQAVKNKFDQDPALKDLRSFFYMPFEHSEELEDQQRAVELMTPLGGGNVTWAKDHLNIIERFGRFPHRNAVMGRISTAEEVDYLSSGGFGGGMASKSALPN